MSAIVFLRAEWWYDHAASIADEAKRAAKRQQQQKRQHDGDEGGSGGGERRRMSTPRERIRALLSWGRTLLSPTPEQIAATGGEIGAAETASLLVQRIIRRWLFLGTITAITFYLWVIRDPIWHHSPADSWNYFLSWLAIAIESVVGMFFFQQALRDAKVIRQIMALAERTEQIAERIEQIARVVLGEVESLEARPVDPSDAPDSGVVSHSYTRDSHDYPALPSPGSRRSKGARAGSASPRRTSARAHRGDTAHE